MRDTNLSATPRFFKNIVLNTHGRRYVQQVNWTCNSFRLIVIWQLLIWNHASGHVHDGLLLLFNNSVMLLSVSCSELVLDPMLLAKLCKFMWIIFTSTNQSEHFDGLMKLLFSHYSGLYHYFGLVASFYSLVYNGHTSCNSCTECWTYCPSLASFPLTLWVLRVTWMIWMLMSGTILCRMRTSASSSSTSIDGIPSVQCICQRLFFLIELSIMG